MSTIIFNILLIKVLDINIVCIIYFKMCIAGLTFLEKNKIPTKEPFDVERLSKPKEYFKMCPKLIKLNEENIIKLQQEIKCEILNNCYFKLSFFLSFLLFLKQLGHILPSSWLTFRVPNDGDFQEMVQYLKIKKIK